MNSYYSTSSTETKPLLRSNPPRPVFLNPKGTEIRKPMGQQAISLRESLARELSLVPEVEAVLSTRHGSVLYVWTVVNDFDPKVRAAIYEREKALVDEFGGFDFDFDIIARRGRDIGALAKDAALDIAFRRS